MKFVNFQIEIKPSSMKPFEYKLINFRNKIVRKFIFLSGGMNYTLHFSNTSLE